MPFLGLFGTGEYTTEQRPLNWRETILRLDPNGDSPMTALSAMMRSEKTTDPTYNWFYEGFQPRILAVNGGVNAAATSITVDEQAMYGKLGALVLVPSTGEVLRISAEPTTDTGLTVTRGFAGTTAAVIPDNAQLTIMGSAYAEGSGAPRGIQRTPVHDYNYTQIFKTPVEHTRTAAMTKTRTGDQVQQDRVRSLGWHMQDIERAVLFGVRSLGTGANGKPLRTTGGLKQFMTSNVSDFGGTGDLDDLDNFYKNLFKFGKDTRICFTGNDFMSKVNKLVRDNTQYHFTEVIKAYGMRLQEFTTPYGLVYFKRHPLLSTDPYYTNSCWHISPENMVYRFITDTTLQENIQLPDEDQKKDQYLTEAGFEFHHESTFGLITNL